MVGGGARRLHRRRAPHRRGSGWPGRARRRRLLLGPPSARTIPEPICSSRGSVSTAATRHGRGRSQAPAHTAPRLHHPGHAEPYSTTVRRSASSRRAFNVVCDKPVTLTLEEAQTSRISSTSRPSRTASTACVSSRPSFAARHARPSGSRFDTVFDASRCQALMSAGFGHPAAIVVRGWPSERDVRFAHTRR